MASEATTAAKHAGSRTSHARAILGPALHERLAETKVLLVGAGGIGCELLKNIVLVGFGHITLLDLDTIDLSNLNRQFLFRKKDVKQSKALVAARTVSAFNPNVHIHPIHGNIKDTQFDLSWFKSFDIVLNALDNLDARRHVNKMCMAGEIPLVESGTAGYLGQVQPLLKDRTECFDSNTLYCVGKELPDGVFYHDILNLLSMEDMWRYRDKPTPLDFDAIKEDRFILRGEPASQAKIPINGAPNGAASTSSAKAVNGDMANGSGANGLKDQRELSLRDSWEMFVNSTDRLAARLRAGEETISFDKDDDDTLDFVTAAANLRSAAYGIQGKSRWEIKEMAGNIIPAIATTNAIISGLIVLQALHLLRKSYDRLRNVHLQFKPAVPLSTITLSPPNVSCGVCRDTYAEILVDPARVTLGDVIDGILGDEDEEGRREVSTFEEKRLLSDPDFDDNLGRTLESLSVTRGKFLSIVDEDGEYETIALAIGVLPLVSLSHLYCCALIFHVFGE
ncbi:hypothetical protein EWM64_g4309 [Hericium alpestre]|uniref:Ubiquitin-activating enzyme E1-like n=1 Tax=Hericium alpestre TaxID=135208 RepID=A0A4Z0A077_9AGAM|nr:hypothetical protein EWM64_g4309 [Hericium alpestre]